MAKPDRQPPGRSGEPQARARPGWREPFVLLMLGLAGLGAAILVCTGAAAPMAALMP